MSTRLLITGLLCLFFFRVTAQTDTLSSDQLLLRQNPSYSSLLKAQPQKYLALDAAGWLGGYHRYRFFPGDAIKFRYRPDGRKYNDAITMVTDTSFGFVTDNIMTLRPDIIHFRIDQVKKVYVSRRIPWITAGSFLFPIAGTAFLLADVVNLSRGEGKLAADSRALITSGTLITLGGICYKLSFPRYRINKNHRLKVLQTR